MVVVLTAMVALPCGCVPEDQPDEEAVAAGTAEPAPGGEAPSDPPEAAPPEPEPEDVVLDESDLIEPVGDGVILAESPGDPEGDGTAPGDGQNPSDPGDEPPGSGDDPAPPASEPSLPPTSEPSAPPDSDPATPSDPADVLAGNWSGTVSHRMQASALGKPGGTAQYTQTATLAVGPGGKPCVLLLWVGPPLDVLRIPTDRLNQPGDTIVVEFPAAGSISIVVTVTVDRIAKSATSHEMATLISWVYTNSPGTVHAGTYLARLSVSGPAAVDWVAEIDVDILGSAVDAGYRGGSTGTLGRQ